MRVEVDSCDLVRLLAIGHQAFCFGFSFEYSNCFCFRRFPKIDPMAEAQASGLLTGRPAELAAQFAGLLWRDLMVSLLLGVAERPTPREIARRARHAAAAFLQLHRPPNDAPTA